MEAVPTFGAVAAHRGWHLDGAPENGIEALEQAHARGADWVEGDFRSLGDRTRIVFHDGHIDGIPLHRLDRRVLAAHPEIPVVDDWTRRAGQLGIGVLAEFKEHGYEAEIVAALRRDIPDGRFDVMSFEPRAVRELARLAPDRPVGLLTDVLPATRGIRNLVTPGSLSKHAQALGASFLGLNVAQTSERMLQAAARRDLGVAVWTVDDPADIARLLADERVATVITDVPDQALSIRRGLLGLDDASAAVRLLLAAATRH